MLTILIPCAGEGRRFREAGYKEPKPLIPVRGVPMLRRVIDNVRPASGRYQFVFICRKGQNIQGAIKGYDRDESYGLRWWYGVNEIDRTTDGAACTCLVAKDRIKPDSPLLITNCDQLVEGGIATLLATDADCAVLTMDRPGESRWSFVKTVGDFNREITRVIEKPQHPYPLRRATTGHYYFRRAGDFFAAAECMIALEDRTNGEFYVAPTINYLITAGKKVVEVRVEDYGGKFVGLGTPEDLKTYEESA